jgi:hypothetical protein
MSRRNALIDARKQVATGLVEGHRGLTPLTRARTLQCSRIRRTYYMKTVFLALVVCCLSFQAHAVESKAEMSARASRETINRLNEQIKSLKGAKTSNELSTSLSTPLRCIPDPGDGPTNCVPHCISRFSDGRCAQFTQDFCGPNAACVEHCISRFSDGRCAQYTDDNCGPWASCTENCISRFSDGRCAQYSADICN